MDKKESNSAERAELIVLLKAFIGDERNDDLQRLHDEWVPTSPGSLRRIELERQIAETVKEEKSIPALLQAQRQYNTFRGAEQITMIEARIREVIQQVILENIPPWFRKQLDNPSVRLYPPWVSFLLRQRAKEILVQIGAEERH